MRGTHTHGTAQYDNSHVTLLEMQDVNSSAAKTIERFEPNTVLWAFHTTQPSSFSFSYIY